MTLDELMKIFHEAQHEFTYTAPGIGGDRIDRAGVTAIVRALRDELCVFYEDEMVIRDTWELYQEFNEILGVAESEKASGSGPASVHTQEQRPDPQVAGGANAVDAQQCQTNTTPATDPAPAVCVWRFNLERSVWRTHCGQYYGPFQAGDREPMKHCFHCSAPIKFTEANHG